MKPIEFSWKNPEGHLLFAKDWKPEGEVRGAVALVHGLGEHIGRYQPVAELLNAAGYSVIGFDLPGHGQSEGKRGHASYDTIGKEIDHLLQEVRQRYPGKPMFLYGHSLGGALVLYYVLQYRPTLCGVVVTSPGLASDAPMPASKLFMARLLARIAPSFTMKNGLDLQNLSHDPQIMQAYQQDPLVHPMISARLGIDLLTKGQWMIEHAAEFPAPLLLEQGSDDHLVSPKATAAFAKNVPADKITYKVWDGLYHETHNEQDKAQVIRYMIDWLDQHS